MVCIDEWNTLILIEEKKSNIKEFDTCVFSPWIIHNHYQKVYGEMRKKEYEGK